MLDVLRTLFNKDLTNKEIRKDYQKRYDKTISSAQVSTYLNRLKHNGLIRMRGKKNGKPIYRSKFREDYKIFNKLVDLLHNNADIPGDTKVKLWDLSLKLLPEPLLKTMTKLFKLKTLEVRKKINEFNQKISEEIKRLYS